MHSVGGAFLWEFWRRYRILTALALVYTCGVVLVVNTMPAAGTLDPRDVIGWIVPVWCVVLLVVPTFGLPENADVLARESPYPRWLFAMPVRTTALVGWPMAIAAITVALVWLLLDALVLRRISGSVPLYWPAVFLAALAACWQAIMWCPYPLISLRMIVGVPVLGAMVIGAALGHLYHVPPALLCAASAALLLAGYIVAVVGVARARRGEVPAWNWPRFHEKAGAAQRPPFASAAAALFWLDWRRNGYALPMLLALMLLPELGTLLMFGAGRVPDLIAGMFLSSVVSVPPLMAAAAGASLGNMRTWGPPTYAMPAFTAARPITAAEIIAVKLRVGVRVFLLTWTATLVALAVIVPFTQIAPTLTGWARTVIDMEGIQGGFLLLFALPVLTALSLKAMVDHLCIGLSGRIWANVAYFSAAMGGAIALAIVIGWINRHPELQPELLAWLPWLVGLTVVLKLGTGVLVARCLLQRGLAAPRTLAEFAVLWCAGAVVLLALSWWLTPPEFCAPMVAGGAAIVLLLPMVRLGLAPLALDWNRHR